MPKVRDPKTGKTKTFPYTPAGRKAAAQQQHAVQSPVTERQTDRTKVRRRPLP